MPTLHEAATVLVSIHPGEGAANAGGDNFPPQEVSDPFALGRIIFYCECILKRNILIQNLKSKTKNGFFFQIHVNQ